MTGPASTALVYKGGIYTGSPSASEEVSNTQEIRNIPPTRPRLGSALGDRQIHALVLRRGRIQDLEDLLNLGDNVEAVKPQPSSADPHRVLRAIDYLSGIFDFMQNSQQNAGRRSPEERLKKVTLLLQAGTSLEATSDGGPSPLHWMLASDKSFCAVPLLLSHGADLLYIETKVSNIGITYQRNALQSALSTLSLIGERTLPDDLWELLELTLKREKNPERREFYTQNLHIYLRDTFGEGTPFAGKMALQGKRVQEATAHDYQAYAHQKVCELKKPEALQELKKRRQMGLLPGFRRSHPPQRSQVASGVKVAASVGESASAADS